MQNVSNEKWCVKSGKPVPTPPTNPDKFNGDVNRQLFFAAMLATKFYSCFFKWFVFSQPWHELYVYPQLPPSSKTGVSNHERCSCSNKDTTGYI